jgi:hypothetical protein
MLDKLKEFVVRIIKDEEFRTELENQPSEQAQAKILEKLGYNFALPDVEAGAVKILELAEQGLFKEVSESELATVFGGLTATGIGSKPQDLARGSYGVAVSPSEEWYYSPAPHPAPTRPWWQQPHNPHIPKYQGMYGVPVYRADSPTSK